MVLSVLLDAGAGPAWAYTEGGTRYGRWRGPRSRACACSSPAPPAAPPTEDAWGLRALARLAFAWRVPGRAPEPAAWARGPLSLLERLADRLEAAPELFGTGRPGGLHDVA
ncbi:MAG: DUF1688 family protein [Planctomycetota bacterium]